MYRKNLKAFDNLYVLVFNIHSKLYVNETRLLGFVSLCYAMCTNTFG